MVAFEEEGMVIRKSGGESKAMDEDSKDERVEAVGDNSQAKEDV